MPRGYGRGMGRGMAAMGYAPYAPYGYRYGLMDRFRNWFYGPGYGRGYGGGYGMGYGMGRGRGYGATMGYCPYTGLPRGWRWTGQYPQYSYPYQYGPYYAQQYRRDEE